MFSFSGLRGLVLFIYAPALLILRNHWQSGYLDRGAPQKMLGMVVGE